MSTSAAQICAVPSCRNRAQLDHHSQPVPNNFALDDLFVCDAEVVDEEQVESLTRRGYGTERREEIAGLSSLKRPIT